MTFGAFEDTLMDIAVPDIEVLEKIVGQYKGNARCHVWCGYVCVAGE